ncbi:MAG TPA: class I SAM-dependent methyltransferase [Blastocatellia bacterium]|nr:class I SAM-dependent methyltransferase [Blastocatellia bacterium]
MSGLDERLLGGSYAQKQIFCKDRIVVWSHTSRYRLGKKLVAPYARGRLLDYGCGDGTFLALVQDLFPEAVGADVDPGQTADCVKRHSGISRQTFVLTEELAGADHTASYDVVACMEVLEHCTEDQVVKVTADLRRLVAPVGAVIISVPIEIGLSLIGKQVVRTLAGWRNLGDYRYLEHYTLRELWKMVFAGAETAIARPVYRADFAPNGPNSFHGHKGFNWRRLRTVLERSFIIRQMHFSPLGWLGGHLSSQVWFVCNPK